MARTVRLREDEQPNPDENATQLGEAGRAISAKNLSLVQQVVDAAQALSKANVKLQDDDEEGNLEESVLEEELTTVQRMKLAKSGQAKSDGSYPIRNKVDLAHAVQAWGRGGAPESDREWIVKRAKALKA